MSHELEQLLRTISELRKKLYALSERRPLTDSEIIALSEEIDQLVTTYHRLTENRHH